MKPRIYVPREAEVEQAVVALYRAAGCKVYKLSGNARTRGTRQSKGLPDLYVVPPAPLASWWHETKRPGGSVRPEQQAFREECDARGVGHVLGGTTDAERHLCALGLAYQLPSGMVIVGTKPRWAA